MSYGTQVPPEPFDFNAREEKEYRADYTYLAGSLGADLADESIRKKKLKEKKSIEGLEPACLYLDGMNEGSDPIKVPVHVVGSGGSYVDNQAINEKIVDERRGFIEKVAQKIAGMKDIEYGEENLFLKDGERFRFLKDFDTNKNNEFHRRQRKYYLFVRGCIEREIDWRPYSERQRQIDADRRAKLQLRIGDMPNSTDANGATTLGTNNSNPADKFPPGTRVEILNLQAKPELNGLTAKVLKYIPESGRFQILIEKFKIEKALKEANIMMLDESNNDKNKTKGPDPDEDVTTSDNNIPIGAIVIIHSLQSATGKLLNGLEGEVVSWEESLKRFNVKLLENNAGNYWKDQIKQLKPDNVKPKLPKGWTEHWDAHLLRHFYRNEKSGKVQWKHPTMKRIGTAQNAEKAFNKKGNTNDISEANEDAENADNDLTGVTNNDSNGNNKGYNKDQQYGEGEGGFNLHDLVNKVEREERRKRKREERRLKREEMGLNTELDENGNYIGNDDDDLDSESDEEGEGGGKNENKKDNLKGTTGTSSGSMTATKRFNPAKRTKYERDQDFKPEVLRERITRLRNENISFLGPKLEVPKNNTQRRDWLKSRLTLLQRELGGLVDKAKGNSNDNYGNTGLSSDSNTNGSNLKVLHFDRFRALKTTVESLELLLEVEYPMNEDGTEASTIRGSNKSSNSSKSYTTQKLNHVVLGLLMVAGEINSENGNDATDEDLIYFLEQMDQVSGRLKMMYVE